MTNKVTSESNDENRPTVNRQASSASDPTMQAATAPSGSPMPEVPDLLARIAGRIAANETRQENSENQEAQAEDDMRERLRSLKKQASEGRAEPEPKDEGAFSNVELALKRLSQQVKDQEDLSNDQADKSEKDAGVVAGMPDAPWNKDAAEKLTTHCEAAGLTPEENKDKLLIGAPEQNSSEAPFSYVYLQPNSSENGQQWFAQRFDEMSKRLDAVASDMPAQTNARLTSLLERFDALEGRISALLEQTTDGGADAGSGSSLHDIELCIAEIAGQLEATTTELARIEGIERQIAEVAKAIAERRDTEMPAAQAGQTSSPFDIAALADMVAKKVATRSMSPAASETGHALADGGGLGELSATVKEFVREQRSEGEHTNAVLDTMQQTIIRVLDRMEALETSPTHAARVEAPQASAQPSDPAPTGSPADQVQPPVTKSASTGGRDSVDAPNEKAVAAEPASTENASLERLQRVMGQLEGTVKTAATASEPEAQPARPAEQGTDGTRHRVDVVKTVRATAAKTGQQADGQQPTEALETDRARFAAAARQAAANANKRMLNDDITEDEIDATHDGFSLSSIGARLLPSKGGEKTGAKGNSRTRLLIAALAIVAVGLGATKYMMSMSSGDAARAQHQSSQVQRGAKLAGGNAANPPAQVAMPAMPKREMGAGSFAQGVQPGSVAYGTEASRIVQPASVAPDAAKAAVPGGEKTISRKALPSVLVGPLSMRLAAANGDPSAEFQVAARYAEGKGVKQDLAEALKWYRRSAARGFALSQYRLGTFYERGLTVAKDVQRARVWYQRAASLDNVKAMHNLAVLAAGPSSGKPDYEMAAKWFTAAAERGLGDSQFNLAILYSNGLGVPQDDAMAYKWFSRAATSGDKEALRRLTEVAAKLGKVRVATLKAEMSRWAHKPTDRMANDPHYAGQAWQRKSG